MGWVGRKPRVFHLMHYISKNASFKASIFLHARQQAVPPTVHYFGFWLSSPAAWRKNILLFHIYIAVAQTAQVLSNPCLRSSLTLNIPSQSPFFFPSARSRAPLPLRNKEKSTETHVRRDTLDVRQPLLLRGECHHRHSVFALRARRGY